MAFELFLEDIQQVLSSVAKNRNHFLPICNLSIDLLRFDFFLADHTSFDTIFVDFEVAYLSLDKN